MIHGVRDYVHQRNSTFLSQGLEFSPCRPARIGQLPFTRKRPRVVAANCADLDVSETWDLDLNAAVISYAYCLGWCAESRLRNIPSSSVVQPQQAGLIFQVKNPILLSGLKRPGNSLRKHGAE